MLHLALLDQLLDRSRDFLHGHIGVHAMLIEQINRLDSEPFQGSLHDPPDAFRLTVDRSLFAAVAIEAKLRGDDHLVPYGRKRFAHQFFVLEWT